MKIGEIKSNFFETNSNYLDKYNFNRKSEKKSRPTGYKKIE